MDDDDTDIDLDDPAALLSYREAYNHAKAIKDAATYSMRAGYWAMRGVPVEREAMVAAIAEKMRVGTKAGYRPIPLALIEAAVDAVLEGRGPAA